MKHLHKILLVSAIILLLFITSCGSRDRKPGRSVDYMVGTEGLYVRTLPNAPPPIIHNLDEFEFLIEVSNRGGFPNEYTRDLFGMRSSPYQLDAVMYVTGLDTTYFPIFQGYDYANNPCDPRPERGGCRISPDLYGKDPYNTLGNQELLTVKAKVDLKGIPSSMEQKYKVELCYKYVTYANPSVCIDPDPYTQRVENEICTPHDITLSSQAAPIAITRIEQDTTSSKAKFRIYIRNVGRGFPYTITTPLMATQTGMVCPDFDYEEINKVLLSQVMVSNFDITQSCRPLSNTGEIRLINGEAVINCEFCLANVQNTGADMFISDPFTTKYTAGAGFVDCGPLESGIAAFETPLRIVLGYGYYDSTQGSIKILQS